MVAVLTPALEYYYLCFPSPFFTVLMLFMIALVCLTGDHLLVYAENFKGIGSSDHQQLIRATVDSSTHALVGFFVWVIVENTTLLGDKRKWFNCFAAAVLAALVDVDHFLAAGSLQLQDALNLPRRPPFHNTSLVVVVALVLSLLHVCRPRLNLQTLPIMFLCSWLSHHLRDANHRGLWLYPFGHTQLLSTDVYITSIALLALFARILSVAVNANKLTTPLISQFYRTV